MKLTSSELQIMELFWNEGRPLTSHDILGLSPVDKLWNDNSIYIMIKTLQKKGAIREIGAVKGKKGKYLRLLEPTLSSQEYRSRQLIGGVLESEIPALFSALIKDMNIGDETIEKLEEIMKAKKAENG